MMDQSNRPNSVDQNQTEEFVRLLSREQPRIFAFINVLLPNVCDAEEVMQETSLILWRKWRQFKPDADFGRWARGIARLEVLKYRRQQMKDRIHLSESLLEQIASIYSKQIELEKAHDASRRDALRSCLNKLRSSDRQLIECRYSEKTTTQQIAEKLGRPASTVYQALSRVRGWLFDCIERTMAREEHA